MTSFQDNNKRKQPSKAARKRVKETFEPKDLATICVEQDFSDYATKVELSPWGQRERFYWHQDNGSEILAVAHLDTVQADTRCSVTHTSAGWLAASGGLDDRLGVYVILEMLPKLGIRCDWLLTTDEESCRSTAEDFETEKQYRWMIEFDRGGTDVVMYQYETQQARELVEDSGSRVGDGSFSDIAALEHLGCVGFNWGVGYQDYHSQRSHAWLEDTFRMVARFEKFYRVNSELSLPHSHDDRWSYGKWEWDKDDSLLMVADCGHEVDLNDNRTYIEIEGGRLVTCFKCGNHE